MDTNDSINTLKEIAQGSFGKVIQKNDKMILIETNTEKIKNSVMREFIEEAIKDGYSHEDLVTILLAIDEAIENNMVRKTLKEYLK